MFWFFSCFRNLRQFLVFWLILTAVVWGIATQSSAERLPIFFSTDLLAQNSVKFGPRSFRDAETSVRYRALKANVQYPEENFGGPKDFHVAGLRKFRAGDEVHSVISRKNAQKAKTFTTSEFGKSNSHIRGKNMTVTKMSQGDKVVSMDVMMDETRREEIRN